MPQIRVLADAVANQIAAGEVVERPAAVVKELVENALDAGARRIEVEFRHGGRSLIRVEDDGSGMSREDARLSLERHATSKLRAAADLDTLATFGFRGEALPSIASVSTFQMQTRRAEDPLGTEILVEGGKLRHVRDCGMAPGTRMVVGKLFDPVPARRKFLKSDMTEAAHIIQCVRLYALAWPEVGFTLLEDGRTHLRTAPCTQLRDRIGEVRGRDPVSELMPVSAEEDGWRIHGYISRPGVHRGTRQEITCFVNRRPVDSRALTYGLIEALSGSMPEGRYPVAVLFLELPAALVDVNVHPTKREVRFRDEQRVRKLVMRAVWDALRPPAEPALKPAGETPPPPLAQNALRESVPSDRPLDSIISVQPEASSRAASVIAAAPAPSSAPAFAPGPRSAYGRGWRWLGPGLDGYSLFESAAGLVVLDPRAAAERIWFERLAQQLESGTVETQRLLFPIAIQLEPVESALLEEHRTALVRLGFEIADFGRDFYRIEGAPPWVDPSRAETLLRDVIGLAREGRLPEGKPAVARQELARLAARRAAPAAPPTSQDQALRLVEELFRCGTPLSDATGRPTLVEIGHGELARRFGRR